MKSQHEVFIVPPLAIKYFALGYNEAIADSFWLRAIQDFDACGHNRVDNRFCPNSWVFQMLDRITDLAPMLRIAYVEGGTNLDIIVHDREGARRLFDKGLLKFPHYWNLEYRAAYHFIFEEKDLDRAQQLLLSAFKDGGPPWLPSLAGKLMSDQGKTELAIKVLSDIRDSLPDGEARDRIVYRLKKLEQAAHESE